MYSCIIPRNNTKKNKKIVRMSDGYLYETHSGRGSRKIISRSKTKKIMATKKKWRENGIRAFINESNPHSNLVSLFRFSLAFILTRKFTIIKSILISKKIRNGIILRNTNVEILLLI